MTPKKIDEDNRKLLKANFEFSMWVDELRSKLETKEEEIAKLTELLEDVLWQACADIGDKQEDKLDNMCLSAYEEAMSYLAKKGRIRYNGRTGRLIKDGNTQNL